MSQPPRNPLARTARLASLPLSLVGRAALGAGKRLGGQPAAVVAAQLQQRTAEQLFSVLGELKGGAMKVGQALSVLESALPEEMAAPYRAVLTKLQESAPPMPTATTHAVLAEHLGQDWRTMFRDFDSTPAACASIGQVHRATWQDGRPVAVKVQYPGAGPALLGDFRRLSRVTKLATSLLPGIDLGPVLDELVLRVGEELDYAAEADHQRAFAAAFAEDAHVRVPDVVHQAGTVLVSDWVGGIPLSSVIDRGSAQQRDRVSERYLEFLLAGPQRARRLHADPHPGNFRLLEDGRLGVLDFGSVDRLPDGLPKAIGRVLRETLTADAASMTTGLREEGFIRAGSDLEPERVWRFLAPFIEPLREDTFTFQREWLRGHSTRLQDPRGEDFGLGLRLTLPPEYLLIHRVWLGGIAVLCQIGGTVPARAIVDTWVPGAHLGPTPVSRSAPS
ncbi:MAG TPA: AarF/ABC1/UbiB kinase family protein [Dermatophilaceae bacterium]|nr:AarF/ABC1/UbiB kinase family protein [Dermatophilaceae bacterium]